MSQIRDNKKTASYITKYISKSSESTARALEKGQHLFYASRGLAHKEVIWQGWGTFDGGFENEWCKVKFTDFEEVAKIMKEGFEYERTGNSIHKQGDSENASPDSNGNATEISGGRADGRGRGDKEVSAEGIPNNVGTSSAPALGSGQCGGVLSPDKVAYSVSDGMRTDLFTKDTAEYLRQFTILGK